MADSEKLLKEQLYSSPPTVSLDKLCFGDGSFRDTAPYALEAYYPNQKKMMFFQYTAVVCQLQDFLACLVFGVHNNTLFPYAGHFLIKKEKLRDPRTEEPPKTLKYLQNFQEFEYFSLFGVLNRSLAKFSNYFLYCPYCPEYEELLNCSQDAFFTLINRSRSITGFQVKKEASSPGKKDNDASLAITDESMQRILKRTVPLSAAKQKLKESARFHSQVFSLKTTTRRNSSDVIDCNQRIDRDRRTNFCAAYEDPGCMAFFETSLLLGQIDNRYIVGVCCSESFSIIATDRIYDRSSGQRVAVPNDIFQSLQIPDWIDENQALCMLETRQILQKPEMYRKQIKILKTFFQFDDHVPEKPLSRTCKKRSAPKAEADILRSLWIRELVDETFSTAFQNSMLEFPDKPSSANNPGMFCLNIVRLWIQEVLRIAHSNELDDISFAESPLLKYFCMSVSEFIDEYLPLYGLSPDCKFQCQTLDSHGNLEAICEAELPINCIGRHVLIKHVGPLLERSDVHFVPFLLIPPPYVTLSNSGDVAKLEKCRSIVQQWSGIPYVDILRQLKALATVDQDATFLDSSCTESSDVELVFAPPKRTHTEANESIETLKKKKKQHDGESRRSVSPRSPANSDTPKTKYKLRKRPSFEMQLISKIMKERNVL